MLSRTDANVGVDIITAPAALTIGRGLCVASYLHFVKVWPARVCTFIVSCQSKSSTQYQYIAVCPEDTSVTYEDVGVVVLISTPPRRRKHVIHSEGTTVV
jgi:hypothetical protein